MSSKKKKQQQQQQKEKPFDRAQRLAEMALKNFIDDLNKDPTFSHRMFYPVVYSNSINKDHMELEYYLFKAENFAVNSSIITAILLANGPLLPERERIKLPEFCKTHPKLIIDRTMVLLEIIDNHNLAEYVFSEMVPSPSSGRTDMDNLRHKFSELSKSYNKLSVYSKEAAARPESVRIQDSLSGITTFFQQMFVNIKRSDVEKVVDFLRYMCDDRKIISDFNYGAYSNAQLEKMLDYSYEDSTKVLSEKIDMNTIDKFIDDQTLQFVTILTAMYDNYINNNPPTSVVTGQSRLDFLATHKVFNNLKNIKKSNIVQNMLVQTGTRIGELTRNFFRNIIMSHLNESVQRSKYVQLLNEFEKEAEMRGRTPDPHQFLNLHLPLSEFLKETHEVRDDNIGYFVRNYIEQDLQTLSSFTQPYQSTSSSQSGSQNVAAFRDQAFKNLVNTIVDNFIQMYNNSVQRMPISHEEMSKLYVSKDLLKEYFINNIAGRYGFKVQGPAQPNSFVTNLTNFISSKITSLALGSGISDVIEVVSALAYLSDSPVPEIDVRNDQVFEVLRDSSLMECLYATRPECNAQAFCARMRKTLADAGSGCASLYDDLTKLAKIVFTGPTTDVSGMLSQDQYVDTIMEAYYNTVIRPTLYEMLLQLSNNTILEKAFTAKVISKDKLGLDKLINSSVAGILTWDGAAFNDLAQATYIFMGDTYAGVTGKGVDETMDFLDKVYGLRYYNNIIFGKTDAYLFMKYVGNSYIYKGSRTKIPVSRLRGDYKYLFDPFQGLYKHLPKIKTQPKRK